MFSSIGFRFYFGVFLLNCISMAAQDAGLNLHCVNDFERLMMCALNPPPDDPSCAVYTLNTRVEGLERYTERSCNLTPDPVRTGRCSCSLDINGFNVADIYNTTLRKAGALVEFKNISAYDNIKPKAPILTSVTRENENYLVTWDTKYNDTSFELTVWLNYRKKGENGTEVDVSFMEYYEILGKSLEPSTEYLVSVQSYSAFYSERSGDLTFTTPVSPGKIVVLPVIMSLWVAAIIIMYRFFSWWDRWDGYKNSTLFFMVPGDHKVLMPQKTPLSSVYVEACKEDKFDEKPLDTFNSYTHINKEIVIGLRRKATLYVVNLIIPSCSLITVDLFSFLLPPQSVDRSAFKMTLILGYTVFLLLMNDWLPVTGHTIPLINVFFSLCMALMVASLLETNLHSSSRRLAPVPHWVRVVFLGTLERLVGLPPMPPKEHSTDPNAAVEEGAVYMNPPGGKHLVDTTLDALRKLGRDLQAIRRQVDRQQRGNHNSEEWLQVAGVIDRFLFWLYAVFIIVSFVVMICIWAFSYSK
ncbi:unnamed protein product [Arctogadus glacialis]